MNWADLLGPAMGAFGSYGAAAMNMQGNREQNKLAQHEAAVARAYNTEMSNTAYQRGTADMRAAGLNPALAVMGGGGASTPTASAPGVVSEGPGNAVAAGISSAMEGLRLKKELNLADEQTRKVKAEADLVEAEVPVAKEQAKVGVETAKFDKDWVKEDGWMKRGSRFMDAIGGFGGSVLRAFIGRKGTSSTSARDAAYRSGYERGTRAGTRVK